MNKNEIYETLVKKVTFFFNQRGHRDILVNEKFSFLDNRVNIDSIGKVQLIVEIECHFIDLGYSITLDADDLLNSYNSPLKSIKSLTDFIYDQIKV